MLRRIPRCGHSPHALVSVQHQFSFFHPSNGTSFAPGDHCFLCCEAAPQFWRNGHLPPAACHWQGHLIFRATGPGREIPGM